jgi:hypothetical protein
MAQTKEVSGQHAGIVAFFAMLAKIRGCSDAYHMNRRTYRRNATVRRMAAADVLGLGFSGNPTGA